MGTMLKTPRLLLRAPKSGDAPAIARHMGNWNVARMLSHVAYPYSPERAAQWVRTMRRDMWYGTAVYFVLTVPDKSIGGGEALGIAGLTGIARDRAELGYWLGEPYWGRGLMSETVAAVTDFAFARIGLEQITAAYMTDNDASSAVLRRAGFHDTGLKRIECSARGGEVLCRTMALARPETGTRMRWNPFRAGALPGGAPRGAHPL